MNQLDEAKKIVRRAAADAVQNYEYSMSVAKQMQEHMKAMIPAEPNWDEEFAKDPAKARELQRYHEKANGFRAQLNAQMSEAQKKMEQSNQAQLAAFAEEESAKFEASNRKNWSDPKKKAKDLVSMRKTGLSSGFTEEELSQVYDSRMLQVLLKASKYDRMMAAKPKPVIPKPQGKPISPGAGSAKQRTAQKGVSSAMKRLNRTGSLNDAAVVFDQLIARGS
jgi:lysozyme family protein